MAKLHLNPLKLSHYPNINQDFVGDAVQEALEQRDAALAKIERLQTISAAKLHKRKCHECGHTSWCADGISPYCLCDECGSQDTRRVKDLNP